MSDPVDDLYAAVNRDIDSEPVNTGEIQRRAQEEAKKLREQHEKKNPPKPGKSR